LGQLVVEEIPDKATLDGASRNNFDGVRLLGAIFVLLSHSLRFQGAQNL
jgi:peptidoglycan/LPS O-acetylase OafA/YrhL